MKQIYTFLLCIKRAFLVTEKASNSPPIGDANADSKPEIADKPCFQNRAIQNFALSTLLAYFIERLF